MINFWNGEPEGYISEFDKEHNAGIPKLEAFALEDGKKHSCILVIPGGGYDHLSNHEGANVAEELNKQGISAFVLYYRVAPYSHPIFMYDVKRAMRYIRFNADKYNIDANKIGVMGFSAGGHLACSLAEHYDEFEYSHRDEADSVSARPDFVCLSYPVISFEKPISHMRSGDNFVAENKAMKKYFNCEDNVRADMPPVFIWHTFSDGSVDCRNSLELAGALKANNVRFELHIFPDGKHGLDLAKQVEGTDQWFGLFINWLRREKLA